MRSTFEPCIPTGRKAVPATPEWIHEVKYDGFRLIVHRDGDRVRLLTRNGHDWSGRYPWIVESALKNRSRHFVIDGEAVVLGADGVANFNALYSRQHDEEVQLYAFDVLALDGDDLRALPLSKRETSLARLLRRRPDGIFIAPFEVGQIGPDLFRAACRMGLEGMVSKHRERPYQAGRFKHWVKIKNRTHPAMYRVMDALAQWQGLSGEGESPPAWRRLSPDDRPTDLSRFPHLRQCVI
jgi:bifunctional non-homologous end joining protein LigD